VESTDECIEPAGLYILKYLTSVRFSASLSSCRLLAQTVPFAGILFPSIFAPPIISAISGKQWRVPQSSLPSPAGAG